VTHAEGWLLSSTFFKVDLAFFQKFAAIFTAKKASPPRAHDQNQAKFGKKTKQWICVAQLEGLEPLYSYTGGTVILHSEIMVLHSKNCRQTTRCQC